MVSFQLVLQDGMGDCTELLRGAIPPRNLPEFLFALHYLKAFIPQLDIVIAGHAVTAFNVTHEAFNVQGEPAAFKLN